MVETSGKQLTVAADAKVTASGGQQSGKWLLDPETVNIEADGGAPGSGTVAASAIAAGLQANDVEISASQRINVNSAIVSGDAGYHTLRLLADGKVAPASVYTDTGDPFADAKRNDSGSIYINAPILLKDGHLYIAASGDVLLNNTTGSQTGDAGYMGRAIIDVGNGTVWIKTSKSASVIQQEGTALIGKQVAVEGASVLLDSPLNHAGTLAGKATNGKFLYNQTSNGDVNTGTVRIDHGDGTSETMEGVSSSAIAKLGEQWIWERTGDTPHHLTLDETTPFQYLVFEALEYVDHKDHKPIAGDRTDSDYWVSSLTFKNPATGDVWVVSSDPTSTSGISVSRNGEATTEMPPGFALGTDLGSVTASANGWGVTGGTGDQGNPAASNAINRHGAANTSDKLVVDLGSNTSSVDANANELWHSGNKYESGVVSFLGSKDTSEKGGVTLKSQTAQLQGTIADAQREYGEANPAFSASVGVPGDASENSRAVKGVDDFVDRQLNQNRFDVKVSPTTTATVESNVGDYRVDGSVQADGFVGQRYQTTVKPGTLHVTPAELIVTAKDKEKSYGDADPALDYNVSGAKLGQTGAQLLNGGTLVRQPGEDAGQYRIEQGQLALNNGLGGNYTLTFVDGQLQINKATLLVTADDKSKTYGDADPALSYQVSGLKNGDTREQVLSAGSVRRDAGENVGNYAITNDDLALLSSNYILQFQDGVFSITPAELTVVADEKQKVYGDADPSFTYQVSGLKRGDTSASVLNGGALVRESGENVGKYGIQQGMLNLNGDAGQNYVLRFVEGDFFITPASLTVDADGKTKVYGDFDPALTYRVNGLKNGDSQTEVLTGLLQRAPGEDVGSYDIRQGSLDLASGKGQNYVLSFTGNEFTITPARLTVTADSQTKVYGDLDPTLTYTVAGLKNADSQAEVLNGGALNRAPGEAVGDYGISQGDLALNQGKGGNYVLSFVKGNLAITPATLTVEAQDQSKVYGNADPALTHVVHGLKNGDSAADVLNDGSLARVAGEDVGQYRIHQGSIGLNNLQGSNYVLQFVDGSLTITPASLSVTANDQSRVYGDLDPALTFSINGLKGGDSVADVLNGGQLSRQPGEDVGTYEIGQGELGLGGSKGQNYILSYEAGTFTVTPATLTVRADDRSKVYGEIDPTLSYQVSGLKRGDTSSSVLKGALRREAGENVKADGYTIGQGNLELTSQNYILRYEGGAFTITPASLRIDIDDQTKVYGDIDPSLSYRVSGLANGDTARNVLSGTVSRTSGENVGDYAIGKGSLGANANYILTVNDGTLAITPAELTVSADDKTKVYGDLDPVLTYSVTGLRNGDNAAEVVHGQLVRTAGEDVTPDGYAISRGNVVLTSGNYRMVFKDGSLQVTPAPLKVKADDKTKAQGESDPSLTYSVSGLKRGDSSSVVQGQLSRQPGEEPGQYRIEAREGFSAGNNYTVSFEEGSMTITGPLAPAPLPPLPITAQSPGNTRCTAIESPSSVSANYSVSPAVIRTYAVQLVCKPRSYGETESTVPTLLDVLSYANSRFSDGKFIVPDWNRSVIPHQPSTTAKGGK
ncbi:MBG domain-containing protein [Pseudomonas aeruginosa]|uniref:MBG domain-containing protein n=1 Tax=Pseudomonas aeruginosa TaxID=287 RepID=UPI000F830CF5|nr:MBG domain-containing protein [Pseudomonas aeruginosa]MBX5650340.1 MBG-2 domain-containing protein [Pseudomonas aeruginosa]MCS7902650.1 MBG-2 domain-containing protein [Pseudomonas aeruginosa]MCU9111485.1 MBG-2 domain-containing protein [Pseudomonas aeruginosa]MCY0418412.1 MBG domain-containing protein [Pseudomonas aeruginosa]MCY0430141.1 MBG domain-containing protein [Pseudomonas aeruginosa]